MQTIIATGIKVSNSSTILVEPADIKQQLTTAFNKLKTAKCTFSPEIKVKRKNDTLYISEVSINKMGNLIARTEVGTSNDHALVPIAFLDEKSLSEILKRLK